MAEPLRYYEDEDGQSGERDAALMALGVELSELRSEAIRGRYETGIEEEWLEDEEFYEGIDDMNRHERGGYRSKPPGQEMLGDEDSQAGTASRGSTVFFNMTRSYCDAGAARVADMLLPTDDIGWSIQATTIPELVDLANARLPGSDINQIRDAHATEENGEKAAVLEMGQKTRDRFPETIRDQVEESFQDVPDVDQRELAKAQSYLDMADSVAKEVAQARASAEKAQKRIEDWHVECQYSAHTRQVIEDASRIGTGVLKGPIPVRRRAVAFSREQNTVVVAEKFAPASVRVDPWNCFPDPGCGENIHDGAYHWERTDATPRKLADLRGQPGYYDDQIDAALEEGPHKAVREWDPEAQGKAALLGLQRRDRSKLFEIWYGYVFMNKEQFDATGVELPEEFGEHPFIPMAVTMVNNRVIKASLNHLDTGEFPYDYMVWQRRVDLPYGIGIARQIRTAQRVINAAARNLMNNMGLAGGPMWYYLDGIIEPLDGVYEIRPRKGWAVDPQAFAQDPRLIEYAFHFVQMDPMQEELQAVLEIGLKMAEDVTGLPMLLQGQMGQAPDTVGGMQMLHNNASSIMRRIARLFDDLVTEPHVRRYYAWLLQHGERDDEKGDFQIDARGSSTLVERDINAQAILQLGQFVGNPQYGIDPKKWMTEFLKSQRLDHKQFEFDDEEWQKIVEGLAQQAQAGDSSVEVATIRAQAMAMVQQLKNQSDDADRELEKAKLALVEERESNKALREEGRNRLKHELEVAFAAIKDELERMKLTENIKADLAKHFSGIEAQFLMRAQEQGSATPELTAPPTEPPERAPPGESFQR